MTGMMIGEIRGAVINQSILIIGAMMTSQEGNTMSKAASGAYTGFLKREAHMIKAIDKQIDKEAMPRGSRVRGAIRNNNGVIRLAKVA
jgi:hypothetical protein